MATTTVEFDCGCRYDGTTVAACCSDHLAEAVAGVDSTYRYGSLSFDLYDLDLYVTNAAPNWSWTLSEWTPGTHLDPPDQNLIEDGDGHPTRAAALDVMVVRAIEVIADAERADAELRASMESMPSDDDIRADEWEVEG